MKNRKFTALVLGLIALLIAGKINPGAEGEVVALVSAFFAAITVQKNEHFNGGNNG